MIRVRLLLCVLFSASAVFAASPAAKVPVRVHALPDVHSKSPEVRVTAAKAPSAARLREAILRAVPPRPQPARSIQAATASRPTGYAASWRSNGTPGQIRAYPVFGTEAVSDPLDSAKAFLRANRLLLRLDDPDRELVATSTAADALGGTRIRFTQQWRGLAVWPAEVIVHLDGAGNVQLVDGAYVPTPRRLASAPVVSATAALDAALTKARNVSTASATPPELIVHARNGRRPRLAWKTTVTNSLSDQWIVVVDAMNGEILQRYSNVQTAAVTGSGLDLTNTLRTLRLWQDGATFYLVDTSKQMFDPTSTPPSPQSTRGGILVSDFSHGEDTFSLVHSSNANSWPVKDSVSAAFWLSKTYDYYLAHHGRDSIDGNQGTLTAAVRYKSQYPNAFWFDDQQLMVFGDAQTYAASLDVIAHEMTHGVTSHTANLVYEGQSGALNEAISDIFGEMAEADFYGVNDWQIGSQIGGAIRSMNNPGAFGDPAKMSQFVHTTEDNGGVHTNSGIINRAFYLLAEGLPGAIGRRDAERVFYRALTQHLTKDSQFIDARVAAITSASELFGAGSTQAAKTAAAFDGVEIYAAAPTPDPVPIPVVSGADATLFLYRDTGHWFVGRREGNDPVQGVQLTAAPVAESRAAVSGDGTVAVYVAEDRDVCLTATDGTGQPACLDLPSQGVTVSSVGISPDGARFGFVLLGADSAPEDRIIVVDIATDQSFVYDLSAPVFDGESLSNVKYADVMTFTADGKALVYDALTVVSTAQGDYSAWSIYALDLDTSDVFAIVPVIEGYDVGYPALGHTSDNLLTFEVYDPETDAATVYAANLDSGDAAAVGDSQGIATSPSFTGDDRAVVYAVSAGGTETGADLVKQPLAADHITPSGGRSTWLTEAAYPSMYRRGTYSGPTTTVGKASFASAAYNVNEGGTVTITVLRAGGNKGTLTVSYATSNGSATAPADYTATSGTLTWADGEDDAKTFLVRTASDAVNEGNETVTVRLTGSSLGTTTAATVTIANQAPAPAEGKRRASRH